MAARGERFGIAGGGPADGSAAAASDCARPRRRVGIGLLVVIAVLAALTALRWVDADRPAALPAVQLAVPWLAVPVTAVALLAAALRCRQAAIAAAVLLAVHAALLAPWWIPDRSVGAGAAGAATPDGAPAALTVLAVNLQYGRGDAGTVVDAIGTRAVDVAIMIEVTGAARARLRAAGLERLLPHTTGRVREDAGGTLLYSRHPLAPLGVPAPPALDFEQVAARVRAPGGDVLVAGVHPVPPWPIDTVAWHDELGALAAWTRQVPDDTPLVVAGDLNGSLDHPAVRGLLRPGMVDAHEATGAGLPRTWPRGGHFLDVPAFAHLDHVLADGLHPAAAGTIAVAGSDHAAVWARLEH